MMKKSDVNEFRSLVDRISKGLIAIYLALLCQNQLCLARRALWLISDIGELRSGCARNTQGVSCEMLTRAARIVREICAVMLYAVAAPDETCFSDQAAARSAPILADCRRLLRLIRRAEGPGCGVAVWRVPPRAPAGRALMQPKASQSQEAAEPPAAVPRRD